VHALNLDAYSTGFITPELAKRLHVSNYVNRACELNEVNNSG